MNCREAEQYIFLRRDGALEESQRAALASHLETCASCRRMQNDLDAFVATWRNGDAEVRMPDADLEWRKLQRTLERSPERVPISWAKWIAMPAAVAAAAAVALYIAPGNDPSHPAAPASERIARQETPSAVTPATASVASTVVYVDDKSGWTFVWAPDNAGNGQHI